MATVERLTKQNHDLEKQLHQMDAGHNVQEENQGDSSERGGGDLKGQRAVMSPADPNCGT